MYDQVINNLRQSYDRMVEERDRKEIAPWKKEERRQFLYLLREESKVSLLEIGAGTGVHGKFFQDSGLQVACTDLSPEMVKRCQQNGLEAYPMDFLSLEFPEGAFDAVFALNCLLHVPREDLQTALESIRDLLSPNGLFYLGQYGGIERAGTWHGDHYKPKRFFSFLTDDQIKGVVSSLFQLVSFKRIHLDMEDDLHFQSLVLRRPSGPRSSDD